jgi:hypothetical protein
MQAYETGENDKKKKHAKQVELRGSHPSQRQHVQVSRRRWQWPWRELQEGFQRPGEKPIDGANHESHPKKLPAFANNPRKTTEKKEVRW